MVQQKNIMPIVTVGLIVLFILISIGNFFQRSKIEVGHLLAQDIAYLSGIFKTIDAECDILSFDYQKNIINFLTIKKGGFVGSEVGSMNLGRPEKWAGPYVNDNPTMQGVEYQIVKTNQGYFITPGEGVRLPNGKIIGKDIIFDENADIQSMMYDKNTLLFEGKSLASPIFISTDLF